MVNGATRRIIFAVEADVAIFFAELAAHAGAGDHAGTVCLVTGKRNSALRDRFPCRHGGHLGEAFEKKEIFLAEMILGPKAQRLGSVAELVRRRAGIGERTDARFAFRQQGPAFGDIVAQRADQSQSGHGDPVQAVSSLGAGAA